MKLGGYLYLDGKTCEEWEGLQDNFIEHNLNIPLYVSSVRTMPHLTQVQISGFFETKVNFAAYSSPRQLMVKIDLIESKRCIIPSRIESINIGWDESCIYTLLQQKNLVKGEWILSEHCIPNPSIREILPLNSVSLDIGMNNRQLQKSNYWKGSFSSPIFRSVPLTRFWTEVIL